MTYRKATCIREQDPLKQGLKPDFIRWWIDQETDSRARSIKTRIETMCFRDQGYWMPDSRARSIKTRIETISIDSTCSHTSHSRARSIKTRIETFHEMYQWR